MAQGLIVAVFMLAEVAQQVEVRQGLELWRGPELLFRGPVKRTIPGTGDTDLLKDFHSAQLSPDGQFVYFLAALGIEQEALCRARIPGGPGEFLVPAVEFAWVEEGKYAGHLLATQRAFAKAGRGRSLRPTFAVTLLNPAGKPIRRIGAEGEPLAAVLARVRAMR